MRIKRYYVFILPLFLLFGSYAMYSQDIPPKNEVNIPNETKKDTVTLGIGDMINIDEIEEVNEAVVDTVKTDTILPEKELLEDVVDYYGEDYVYFDRKNNRVYMYNKAYVVYQDVRIDAGLIILDYNKNEVYAKGIDSAGTYSQRPVFVQANNEIEPDSIRFNYDTEKALVFNSRGEENDFKYISEITKKENDSVVFLKNVKFTTSENIEDPEYYFYTRRAKFVPKRKIVTGLTNMYIADVPTPIGLPFAYFPLTEDRASGFIIPTIGENNNRGFFFQNGGYYFAINDYLDLAVLGDYYTNGSYGLRIESDYVVRYKFNGNLRFRLENLINSERGFPDFSQSSNYNIQWSHNQDAKANPNSTFRASVNLGSQRFFQQSINQINNSAALVNSLNSSVSYSRTFDGDPAVDVTIAATHSQNTNSGAVNLSLPNLTANVSRIFPFAPKSGAKKGIIDNINFQYRFSGQNQINTTDERFGTAEMFDDARVGARHTIPISTNFKLLNYVSATMGTNFEETWVLETIRRSFDPDADEGAGAVVTDTISGFDAYRTYNFSTSLGTTIYGTFNFGEDKKIQAIRHTFSPSVSYSINPGFDQFYDDYTIVSADPEINDEVVEYSRFEGSLFGAPNRQFSSSIGISIRNTIEAKVRDRDTTATEPKKINLLNNLNFTTGYNLSADSLNWSPVRFTGSIPIVEKLDLNFNGTLDPYALDNNNNRIDVFNINNGGSLFRLTAANASVNYSFSSRDFQGKDTGDEDLDPLGNNSFRNGGRPDDLFGDSASLNDPAGLNDPDTNTERKQTDSSWYNFAIPWNLRLAYTITYSNNRRENEIASQSLMFSSNFELSPRWSVGVSSGYDFKGKGVTLTQLRFKRDLESWQMTFNWTPIGSINTAWYFYIGIKSSLLKDIKYDQRREPDRRL